MELKRAVELYTEYNGAEGIIRVDKDDYFCLTEMAKFFPNKEPKHWNELVSTKEYLAVFNNFYNVGKPDLLTSQPGIIKKRGKGGGTWAHRLIALEFAMWLSPEFKFHLIQAYDSKKNWSFKRELAANNYKVMCEAVHDAHTPAKFYHYSNEALLLNEIVFGVRDAAVRDEASAEQLALISNLEMHNSTLIGLDVPYEERKEKLITLHNKAKQKAIS